MSWHTQRLALFDFETTGVDCFRDRVVTAAIVEVVPSQQPLVRDWFINPGIDIPKAASDIHGITTDEAQAGGVEPAGAIHEIAEHLVRLSAAGVPVVGHNVVYDLTMLWAELLRHGSPLSERVQRIAPVIDTFVLDKWADTYRKGSRKLVDVAAHYGVALSDADAHGAVADALAAGRVAWKIANAYPGVQVSLRELHELQVEQKRAQAESFGRYLTRQGKVDDVSRDWPVQPPPEGWSPEQLPVRDEAVA